MVDLRAISWGVRSVNVAAELVEVRCPSLKQPEGGVCVYTENFRTSVGSISRVYYCVHGTWADLSDYILW